MVHIFALKTGCFPTVVGCLHSSVLTELEFSALVSINQSGMCRSGLSGGYEVIYLEAYAPLKHLLGATRNSMEWTLLYIRNTCDGVVADVEYWRCLGLWLDVTDGRLLFGGSLAYT